MTTLRIQLLNSCFKLPWAELDREEEALGINQYGGLGFNEKGECLNWYGGKVLFHGKLYDTADKPCTKPKYKLQLDRAELGPSNMFARQFGSKHFFRLKLTKPVMNKSSDELMTYLRRPLILCGSVFRGFYAKDSNVFYVKTNESTDGVSVPEDGDVIPGVKSFLEFVEWHNPMDNNNEQVCMIIAFSLLAPADFDGRLWQNMFRVSHLVCQALSLG